MAIKKLIPTEKITEKNQLEAVKRLDTVVIQLGDKGLDRDLRVLTELTDIEVRLTSLESGQKAIKKVLDEIKTDFIHEQKETNSLLRELIATKRD